MENENQPRLHLDADCSRRGLHRVLGERGFDVTRTPNAWVDEDASDEEQLQKATQRNRIIFTYNVRHFFPLTRKFPNHAGVVIAHQYDWNLSRLLKAFDRLLTETTPAFWRGQVRWLTEWDGE